MKKSWVHKLTNRGGVHHTVGDNSVQSHSSSSGSGGAASPSNAHTTEATLTHTNADGSGSIHRMTITTKASTFGGRPTTDVEVKIYNGGDAAELHGQIDGTTAYINHVGSGRFPGGKGVSYMLIHQFAAHLTGHPGVQHVKLGTPVNDESVNQRATLEGDAAVAGERAALHVYRGLHYDVSTALTATTAQRSPLELIGDTTPRINRWA